MTYPKIFFVPHPTCEEWPGAGAGVTLAGEDETLLEKRLPLVETVGEVVDAVAVRHLLPRLDGLLGH